ncbi:MAG: hypothetical protein IJR00_10860 [Lachnospiraceae bacterium]|nr:hypothetical protein [Lachnospiraceae bacterium]
MAGATARKKKSVRRGAPAAGRAASARNREKPSAARSRGRTASAGDRAAAAAQIQWQAEAGEDMRREELVASCLDRMYEGAKEIEKLKQEYGSVTGQIRDLDTVREMPPEKKALVEKNAGRLKEFLRRQEESARREGQMSDDEFTRMERLQDEYPTAIGKFSDAEDYHRKIKNDLRKLDNEREAYYLREEDLEKTLSGTHDLSIICMAALCAVLAVLFVLQTVFRLNVVYGYMAAVLLAAVAIVFLYTRNSSAARELKSVENTINRLILLQNTVKIRYVNNRNLLDYYELKYGVQKASELKSMAARYEKERDARQRLSDTMREIARTEQDLQRLYYDAGVREPQRLVKMPEVILNPSDESAYRSELLKRRKQLRGQMDYNQDKVIAKAKDEIKRIVKKNPRDADAISAQVDRFMQEKGIRI